MNRRGSVLFVAVALLLMLAPAAGLLQAGERAEGASLDSYVEENVALRAEMITLHARLCGLLWGQSGNEQVVMGREGWLYFQDTLDDTLRRPSMRAEEISLLAWQLSALSEALAAQGVRFTFVCAPNKGTIHPEQLPYYLRPLDAPSNLDRLLAALADTGVHALDLRPHLLVQKAAGPQYYRTDTHWNAAGALSAYRALMAHLAEGTAAAYDRYEAVAWAPDTPMLGDLAAMMLPLATQSELERRPDLARGFSVDGVMRSTSDMLIRTRSDVSDLHVLMLRDSFGDNLFAYLANNIGRLVYTRQLPFDRTMLEGEPVDHVVLEIVERNLPTLQEAAAIIEAPRRVVSTDAKRLGVAFRVEYEDGLHHIFLDMVVPNMEIAMDTSAVVEKDGRLHGYGLYPLSVEVTEDGQVRVRCRLTLDEADFSEEAEVWLAGGA